MAKVLRWAMAAITGKARAGRPLLLQRGPWQRLERRP